MGVVFAALIGPVVLRAQSATANGSNGTVVEKILEPKQLVELSPGDPFAVRVPLRLSKAANLGQAQLDITIAADVQRKGAKAPENDETRETLHLIAHLSAAQASLPAGDQTILLHGVTPLFPRDRAGAYHAVDYSIHLGSGNVTNIGTPDDSLIDTVSLTSQLQDLRLKLISVSAK